MLSWINIVKRPLFSPAKKKYIYIYIYIYIYSKLKNLSDESRTVKKNFFLIQRKVTIIKIDFK